MRGGRNRVCGCISIGIGIVILLALILPTNFWWFFLGAALICGGYGLCAAVERGIEVNIYIIKMPRFIAKLLLKVIRP